MGNCNHLTYYRSERNPVLDSLGRKSHRQEKSSVIHIDASELRSSSRLREHIPKLYPLFKYKDADTFIQGVSRSNLEELAGADVMLTPVGLPITESMIPKHIERGAVLIQLKFGRDLTSSLGDRMKESLWRMRETGARQGQCVLMYVGTLGCNRDGYAAINGKVQRPRRKYEAVMSAIWRWCRRGGVYLPVTRMSHLAETLKAIETDIARDSETFWPTKPNTEMFTDDPLEALEKIDDWRVPFSMLSKLVGPVRATALRNAMLEAGAADIFCQALLWTSAPKEVRNEMKLPRIPGWGEKTFDSVSKAVFGDCGDNVRGDMYLKLELMKRKD